MRTWSYTIAAYVSSAGLYGAYLTVLLRQRRRLEREAR
jgi:hypothetical protein